MADNDPFDVRFRRTPPPKMVDDDPDVPRPDRPTAPVARATTTPPARPDRPTAPFERRPGQWTGSHHPDDVPSPRAVELAQKLNPDKKPTNPPQVPPIGHRILAAKTDPGMARNLARAEPDRQVSRTAAPPEDKTGPWPAATRTTTPPVGSPSLKANPPAVKTDSWSRVTPPTGTPTIGRAPTKPPAASSSGTMRAAGTTPPSSAVARASTRIGISPTVIPAAPTLFVEPDDPIGTPEACVHVYRLALEAAAGVFGVIDTIEHSYIRPELERGVITIAKQIAQAVGSNNMLQRRTLFQQSRRLAADCLALLDFIALGGEVRTAMQELVTDLIGLSSRS